MWNAAFTASSRWYKRPGDTIRNLLLLAKVFHFMVRVTFCYWDRNTFGEQSQFRDCCCHEATFSVLNSIFVLNSRCVKHAKYTPRSIVFLSVVHGWHLTALIINAAVFDNFLQWHNFAIASAGTKQYMSSACCHSSMVQKCFINQTTSFKMDGEISYYTPL